jgi:hypothetical protein
MLFWLLYIFSDARARFQAQDEYSTVMPERTATTFEALCKIHLGYDYIDFPFIVLFSVVSNNSNSKLINNKFLNYRKEII